MREHSVQPLWLVAQLVLVLGACATQAEESRAPGIAGVYALVSVDGVEIPGTVDHDGVALELRSGLFTIRGDGSCSPRTVFVPPGGREVVREGNATYTADGPRLTMRWEGAGTTTGVVEGDLFTMDNHGMMFRYRRRLMILRRLIY